MTEAKLVARLEHLLCAGQHVQLCRELLRVELAGELGACQVLCFHARLALAERTAFALDYLEMAQSVAVSADEHRLVAELRARAGGWSPQAPRAFNA